MLIEQTTTYAYKLKYLENPSFDKVRNLAKKFIDELPKELVDDLYNAINRGVDILKTEPEMLVYLYSFGNMHKAKLNYAFDKIPEDFFSQPEINVIDYGCGQAIGMMCYADFLKSKNYNQKIKSVTLIEPSKKCLRRAALHMSIFLPDAEITTVNKIFDELVDEDINCDEDVPMLHILSNVLDLEFNISKFTKLVKDRLKGYNQFVCVGPYFGYDKKDFRMEDFAELVGGDISFSKSFGKGQFVEGKNWTCQVVVASVGELEEDLSTEVTDGDIKSGVEDECGVVYSRDGKRLLKGNPELRTYIVKNGAKVICDKAFEDSNYDIQCFPHLYNIVIPESVTTIGNCAFLNCGDLTGIILPSSITKINNNPFAGCGPLKIEIESKRFLIVDNMLIDTIEHRLISYFGQDEKVIIPKFVTKIGEFAFSFDVPIPSDYRIIYTWQPSNLKKIIIPDYVTEIENYAFRYCRALECVIIENPTLHIGSSVYEECDALKKILIPENSIEHFKHILPEIIWDKLEEGYSSEVIKYDVENGVEDDFGVLYSSDGTKLLKCNNEKIKSYVIKEGTKVICNSAFAGCKYLPKISIPDSVTTIGNYAFQNCIVLQYINIPISVQNIGECAFCNSVKQVQIPNSVTTIGDGAFTHCTYIKITEPKSFVTQNDMLIDLSHKKLLRYYGSNKHLVIPDSIEIIGKCAFNNCATLQTVVVSDSVITIEDKAFADCKFLKHIIIPNSVITIGKDVFINCRSLKNICIPNSVMKIGDGVFYGCEFLQQIMFPEKIIAVKNIFGWDGFLEDIIPFSCKSLQQIIISENCIEKFKQMLPEDYWNKLYCLKKVIEESPTIDENLPF